MVTRNEIIYAYRLLLGRDPEDEAAIERLLLLPSWTNLRSQFMGSSEFKVKASRYVSGSPNFIALAPNVVDVQISEEHFGRLVGHVQSTWETLGVEKPHWSVLTNPEFLPDNIEDNVTNFYDTGKVSVDLLEKAAARASKIFSPEWECFELGCGVGRVTAHLASRFRNVVACDISLPHLRIASEHLKNSKITNTTFLPLKTLETLKNIDSIDIFYSVIVLQHNPPPLIYRILQIILSKVNIGGFAYFQVPVAHSSYSFSIDDYLESVERNDRKMEMHILPQVHLFQLLDEHGFQLLDIQRDNSTGRDFHSITVFAEKFG
jgi:SAM-dependent methyltransferase